MRTIPTTTTRIEATNARTQSNLNGEIVQQKAELKKAITGKKRGAQKARTRTIENTKLVSMVDLYVEFGGDAFEVIKW